MITEEQLTALFETAAADTEPPPGGASRIRALLGPADRFAAGSAPARTWRDWRPNGGVLAAAAGVLVAAAIGVGIATASHHGSSSSGTSASSASQTSSSPLAGGAPQAVAPIPKPASGNTGAGGASGSAAAPGAVAEGAPSVGAGPVPFAAPRVVKTATITLQVGVGKVPGTVDRLRTLVGAYGGFVANSNTVSAGGDPNGTITLRVPVAAYGQLRATVTGGNYGKMLAINESGNDVTSQYTDLAARISALETSRQTYQTLLANAKSTGDLLAVEQQLDALQQQLEQLQGQQQVLADQSDNATIAITITQQGAGPAPSPSHHSGFGAALHDATAGFTHGVEGLVRISGVVLLVGLCLAAIAAAGEGLRRLVRRRLV